jgi:hypothetical protein
VIIWKIKEETVISSREKIELLDFLKNKKNIYGKQNICSAV